MNEFTNPISKIGDNPAEKILSICAYTVLVIGILMSVVMAIVIWSSRYSTFMSGLSWLVCGTVSSFIIWAGAMIFVNISNNVRQIKQSLQNRPL